jgi:hypothetical protein
MELADFLFAFFLEMGITRPPHIHTPLAYFIYSRRLAKPYIDHKLKPPKKATKNHQLAQRYKIKRGLVPRPQSSPTPRQNPEIAPATNTSTLRRPISRM